MKLRRDLDAAKGLRATIVKMLDDEWAKNLTTSKEDMLKKIDEDIAAMRKKLGLVE